MGNSCSCTGDLQHELLKESTKHELQSEQDQITTPLLIEDPVQLDSYEWDDHKPEIEYARALTKEEEKNFLMQEAVENTLRKHNQLFIRAKLSDNYKRIPKSDQPHLLIQSQSIYVGQWVKGLPHGIGSLYYLQGDLYEGQLIDEIPEGEGRKIWKDGTYYIGIFKQGNMEGQGKMRRADRFFYEGMWKQNIPHGKGMEIWPNKTTYSGEYFEGLKQGRGRFTWDKLHKRVDGDNTTRITQEQYDGMFVNNVFEGHGTYEWPDGRTYEGEWRNGKMDGHGVFSWVNGLKFDGQYRADSKHGEGTMIWADGRKLNGIWRFGRLEGVGTLEVKGKQYQGEWLKGKKVKWIKKQIPDSLPISNMNTELNQVPSERDELSQMGEHLPTKLIE